MGAIRINDDVLAELKQICEQHQFNPGEKITVKGEHHQSMFFILAGWVEIKFLDDRSEACSLRVGERSPLGEMGFLSGNDAIATAVATSFVTALEINQESMKQLETKSPQMAADFSRYLTDTIDSRLQQKRS